MRKSVTADQLNLLVHRITFDAFNYENWHPNDDRLPVEVNRAIPDFEFVKTVVEFGVTTPILMGFNQTEGWFLVDGRKRLLASRILLDNGKDITVPVRVVEMTKEQGYYLTLIQNGQSSDNPMADYAAIQNILAVDKSSSINTIAKAIGKSSSEVKRIVDDYSGMPQWTIDAVLVNKIAEGIAIKVSRMKSPNDKKTAFDIFAKTQKLTGQDIDGIRRVKIQAQGQQFAIINQGVASIDEPVMLMKSDVIDYLNALDTGNIEMVINALKTLL